MQLKQVIVLRADIKMSRGKAAAQAAHASVSALDDVPPSLLQLWKRQGQKKIVLKAKDRDELINLQDKCENLKIPHALISDAGLTEISRGTITALGIGPDKEERINKVTGSLSLMK
ncbi:MAG: peptidyl-tRNA hydrolase [Candidatus Aenigmarchaeota archaeon]|nr:peptidyl-tRNA hydrolase [Candidatus Aenigmarchaeota archaeon]